MIQAARAIAVGDASIAVAGGVESMSRAPWVVQKPERAFPAGHQQMYSTTLGWRMTNPKMPAEWTVALGEGAELIADKHGITREQQDAFALDSHRKAAEAWAKGLYEGEVVPYDGVDLVRDECIRESSTLEALARLKPAFRTDGSVTAGNASPLNDGAAALLLVDEEGLGATGREPLARIRSSAVTGIEPQLFGLGPVEAVRKALAKAGRDFGDLTTFELNEAFAAQSLGCLAEWPGLDPAVVNPAAAPSPSATRSAPPAPGSPEPSPTSWPPPAPARASRPSASEWARAWPSCWSANSPGAQRI